MARTTKPTTALGKFGVYGAPSENERLVLQGRQMLRPVRLVHWPE